MKNYKGECIEIRKENLNLGEQNRRRTEKG